MYLPSKKRRWNFESDPVVEKLKEAFREVRKNEPEIKVARVSNDSAFFARMGIQTINKSGPGNDEVIHSRGQYIELENSAEYIRVLGSFTKSPRRSFSPRRLKVCVSNVFT